MVKRNNARRQMRLSRRAGTAGAAVTCAAALATASLAGDYAIRNVTVVDVETASVLENQTVITHGDQITHIAETEQGDALAACEIIDGSGLFLMPGLFDAHVHLVSVADAFGPMLVAHGIVCARDTGADTNMALAVRQRAEASDSILPRLIVTGAIVDGNPPIWPFSEPCDTVEDARAAVAKLADAGVDQIKVYSLLKKDVYLAAVEQAHARGLKVTGHVPQSVTLEEAMAAGQNCVEHLIGFDRSIVRLIGAESPDDAQSWPAVGNWNKYPLVDRDRLRAFLAEVKDVGIHQCPTIVVMQGIGRAGDPEVSNQDPRMAYVPAVFKQFWSGPQYRTSARAVAQIVPHMQSMVAELHRAGVPLMIGTDLANPYVFPGSSVHEEMQLFQEAGIPAADVLRAATIVPARFCGVEDTLGSVAVGKSASFVLVRRNPLDDIANASEIDSVFLRGNHLDRARLDEIVDQVARTVSAAAPVEAEMEVKVELPGEVIHRGRYAMKFGEYDAGTEDFVITRDESGFHIMSHSRPMGGPQPPSKVTINYGLDLTFQTAEYETLTQEPLRASYTREGQTIRVRAEQGDGEPQTQEMELPDGAIMAGPAMAAEFITMQAADLQEGQTREFKLGSFGRAVPPWTITLIDYTLTRESDTTLTRADGSAVPVRLYSFSFEAASMEFKGQEWIAADSGVLLKSVLTMPFGTVTAELEQAEE